MRSPCDFFKPLALGAPEPVREIPIKPSRSVLFFDPSNEKMAADLPDLAKQADILLGSLKDAIAADRKIAARDGCVRVGCEIDFGDTPLWTRVNSLGSPWCLDDLSTLVGAIGDRLDVVMIPKVEGPWDIHYVDRLLAQLGGLDLRRPISTGGAMRPTATRCGRTGHGMRFRLARVRLRSPRLRCRG